MREFMRRHAAAINRMRAKDALLDSLLTSSLLLIGVVFVAFTFVAVTYYWTGDIKVAFRYIEPYVVGLTALVSVTGAVSATKKLKIIRLPSMNLRPKGRIFDALLPPEEAEHRFLEMDEAFDRWVSKYGHRKARLLFSWQSLISVCLFWFDRVVVKVLARK